MTLLSAIGNALGLTSSGGQQQGSYITAAANTFGDTLTIPYLQTPQHYPLSPYLQQPVIAIEVEKIVCKVFREPFGISISLLPVVHFCRSPIEKEDFDYLWQKLLKKLTASEAIKIAAKMEEAWRKISHEDEWTIGSTDKPDYFELLQQARVWQLQQTYSQLSWNTVNGTSGTATIVKP